MGENEDVAACPIQCFATLGALTLGAAFASERSASAVCPDVAFPVAFEGYGAMIGCSAR